MSHFDSIDRLAMQHQFPVFYSFYSGSVCQQQAMAASLLEDNLRSLTECLTTADNSSKEQADSIVADISQICINESTDKDIGT